MSGSLTSIRATGSIMKLVNHSIGMLALIWVIHLINIKAGGSKIYGLPAVIK